MTEPAAESVDTTPVDASTAPASAPDQADEHVPLLRVRDLQVSFRTMAGTVDAVQDVSFDIEPALSYFGFFASICVKIVG